MDVARCFLLNRPSHVRNCASSPEKQPSLTMLGRQYQHSYFYLLNDTLKPHRQTTVLNDASAAAMAQLLEGGGDKSIAVLSE